MNVVAELAARFVERFGAAPQLFRAPGRVNLIGEHTDYNDGFVLPFAIDRANCAACAAREDRRLVVHSLAFEEIFEFDLDAQPAPRRAWSDYVVGVALALRASGRSMRGVNMMLHGDLPMGAGLSASAALEVVTGFALCEMNATPVDRTELALLCQSAENDFVGARCGVMDQLISCLGVEDHALLIDCRSLQTRPAPIDPRARIVICNTMIRHNLATGAYNQRREECERAVALLSVAFNDVVALRDVSPEQFARFGPLLPEPLLRRARHVVTENARTLDAVAALARGDLARCGALMNASHASLRDDYEVSCREADIMVALAQKMEGVFGARLTGGGFGGCTVNLVDARAVDAFVENIGNAYERETGLTPQIFCCAPSAGVGRISDA